MDKGLNDPRGIIGYDVPAADGGDYGHRVVSFDMETQNYTVVAIKWSTGEVLPDTVVPRHIDEFKISYRYDCDAKRLSQND